jgi:4-diphosphocytidyl-2-C-methyl-D-erythritol kinase
MLLRAFAKINLGLRILGKRSDGYHELRTIFQAIDWFDEIHVERADGLTFSASHGPSDETNLVLKAVRAFERASGIVVAVAIHLKKDIPSGGGLGGGSSDAAAMVIGLQQLYPPPLASSEQQRALSSIGSDVPFFSVGGRALGTGRGEIIEGLDDRTDYWLALVNPGIQIATAEAYSWLTVAGKSNSIEGFRVELAPGIEQAEELNDFEQPVFTRYPQLMEIRNELRRIGAFRAALSGSGSVVFGQFRTEAGAMQAASALSSEYSVKVTRPLSRSEYFSRMVEI